MLSGEKCCGHIRERLNYLATVTRCMFGGVKVRFSNLTTQYQLSSMVVAVLCCGAVLLSVILVHCGKWME